MPMWASTWHKELFPIFTFFFFHYSAFFLVSSFHSFIHNPKTSLLIGIENNFNPFHSSFFLLFKTSRWWGLPTPMILDVDTKWCCQWRKRKVVSTLKEMVALYHSFSNVDAKFWLIGKFCNWLWENSFPSIFFSSI